MKRKMIYFLINFTLLLFMSINRNAAETAIQQIPIGTMVKSFDGMLAISPVEVKAESSIEFCWLSGNTLLVWLKCVVGEPVKWRMNRSNPPGVTSPNLPADTILQPDNMGYIPIPGSQILASGPLNETEEDQLIPTDVGKIQYAKNTDPGWTYTTRETALEMISKLPSNTGFWMETNGKMGNTWELETPIKVPRVPYPIHGNFTYTSSNPDVVPGSMEFEWTPLDFDSAVQGVGVPTSLIAKSTVGMIKRFPPVVTNVPLQIRVGEHRLGSDYTQGIQGHWGFTATNMIPPRGTITRTDLGGGTADPYFSGSDPTGTIHNIGVRTFPVRVKDDSNSTNPAADITDITRAVTSTTQEAPSDRPVILAGTVNAQGEPSPSTVPYSSSGSNPGGGVEGWTNFPITVTCDGSAITGDYALWSVWSPPGNGGVFNGSSLDRSTTITGAGGEAKSITTVFKEPATGAGGWLTKGYCSDKANQSNLLSAQSPTVELKYDPSAPAAGLSYRPETKMFSDTSTDGQSGINIAKTSILFRTVGGSAPSESDADWQPLSSYSTPMTATNYDVYVKAYDKAGNHDLRLVYPNLKLHGIVQVSLDTDKGATIHAVGCPNPTSPTKIDGSCLPGCHDAAKPELTEGSPFNYRYTLHGTDDYAGASGSFTNYLPLGVVPTGTGFTNITSTSGNATVTGTVASSPELLGAHVGQYKVMGNYTLQARTGGDTLTFEVGCRTPQYDPTAGADNTFANHEGNVDFTMDDGYTGTAGYNSAVHKVKPLPMHELTLNKTVTGKYGNRDKVFTFRLDMEQSWGAKLDRTCSYSQSSGATGTISIKNGTIDKLDGKSADSILLKHGQGITIKDLPEGCRYTIAEEPKEGYTATEKVDGADYAPHAAGTAEDMANTADLRKDASQAGSAAGADTLRKAAERMGDTSMAPKTLKQGTDNTAINLQRDSAYTAQQRTLAGTAKEQKLGGAGYGSTAAGVVEGTINTANVQVDYFNDKNMLAPPTGIWGSDSGKGILPAILAGFVVFGSGFYLRKRRK